MHERLAALRLEHPLATGEKVELPGLELLGADPEHDANPLRAHDVCHRCVGEGQRRGRQAELLEPAEMCEIVTAWPGRMRNRRDRRRELAALAGSRCGGDLTHARAAGEEAFGHVGEGVAER